LARYKKYPAQGNAAEGTGAVSAREPSGPLIKGPREFRDVRGDQPKKKS
jgi:hypothetical protein